MLGVLWLAAALRWSEPGLIEFKYDEAHIASMALGIVRGGYFPILSGGTSLGIQRSALDAYLLALPLAITGGHVEAAAWGTGALGVAAVALAYALGRRIGGEHVGVLTGLFMAANPWLVTYDRKLWAHIQVLFSVALLLLAWEVIVHGRAWAALSFPVVAVLQVLAHILALVQGVGWLGAILMAPRHWWRRQTLWGLAVAMALATPYLVALAHAPQTGNRGISATLTNLARQLSVPSDFFTARTWGPAFQSVAGDGISSLVGLTAKHNDWWRWSARMAWLLTLMASMGLARVLAWLRESQRTKGARLLLTWMVGPLLVLGFSPLRVYPQYWTVLLPLPALYLALGLDGLARLGRRAKGQGGWGAEKQGGRGAEENHLCTLMPLHPCNSALTVDDLRLAGRVSSAVFRSVTGVLASLVVLVWVGSYISLLGTLHAGEGGMAFGIPLRRWQEVLAEARAWAARLNTQEIRVAVQGVDPGYESEPAVVATLIGNPPWARFVAPTSPTALLLAYEHPSLYLWTIHAPEAEQALQRWGELVWEGRLANGHPPARFYRLPAASQVNLGLTLLDPQPVFDVGIALMGYSFPPVARAGRPLQVTLAWRVLNPPAEVRARDFTAFNHILNTAGERVAQVDGMALLSRDWWPGDVLLQPYVVQVPAGTYRWRMGFYSRIDGNRAHVSTGEDFIELELRVVE
jgi:4-amino-4-deoxy-L-arabinose transferase-like glycosyltransferase